MKKNPFSSLIERIIEWMDEYYSIRLSGEVLRGMSEKVKRGQPVTIPSFGYDIVDKQYVINEEKKQQLFVKIFTDYIDGKSSMQIASELKRNRCQKLQEEILLEKQNNRLYPEKSRLYRKNPLESKRKNRLQIFKQ